jgi:hypothetical protein
LFWQYTNARMDDFLEMHWNAIETLAHRLIRDRTVSKDEAVALEMAMVDFSDAMMGLNQDGPRL